MRGLSPKSLCLFILMICDQVLSSLEKPYSKNHTLKERAKDERNIIEDFFLDLKNSKDFVKYKPRLVTIAGVSRNDDVQRALKPLFRNYPYIICTNGEKCEYPEIFSRGNFAVIFLNNLTETTFMQNIKIISRCRKCRVLFLCGGIIESDDVQLIFNLALKQNVAHTELAHFNPQSIDLYSKILGENCTMEAGLIDVWRPGTGLEKINRWAYRYYDRKGCPVVVSSMNFAPKMIIEEYKNGSRKIVGGLEGNLILEAARRLNFTVVLKHPSVVDRMKYSQKSAIMIDIVFENAEIGIGRLRENNFLLTIMDFSVPFDSECVTWGVPRIMSWSDDIVFVEFSKLVWAAVTIMFVFICLIGYVHRQSTLIEADDKNIFRMVSVTCDVFALHLGNSVLWVTSSPGGRVLLMTCLCYATVMTTAYKTSLASILATDKGTSTIVDAQGIIRENLSVGGAFYDWNILKDQVNESEISAELFRRFVINNDDSESKRRLIHDHDFGFLASRSWLSYERQEIVRAHESVTFDVFDTCVLAHPTVVSFPNKSLLRKPMNRIIRQLTESGIFNHWDLGSEINADIMLSRENDQNNIDYSAAQKFQNLFIMYSVCIFFCLLVFVIELVVPKVRSENRRDTGNKYL
ncbi:uncharacterized protein LOC125500773 [Athalia rosae]|uniref:uncharacterized protein LOC125500773 n=1 Tax=Athalia rosae TaxID=37344 RepID=UPI00203442F7|nr:uncharacterized protein LOC125500773 [Athalia rosae]